MLTNPAVQAEFGTRTPQAGHCTRPPGPFLRSEHRYCALLKALLPGERSSPAHLGSYKAWRASTAAKQIRIEAGPSFIHERSAAAGGTTKLKLDRGNRSLANASGSERSWPSASLTSMHSCGARSVSEGALPVSFLNDPALAGDGLEIRQRSSLLQAWPAPEAAKQIGCEASPELSLPTEGDLI